MTRTRIEQAARNNAVWCDTVCRAHAVPGEFDDALWMNRHPVPRFYSNVVTLADQRHEAVQMACLQDLLASSLLAKWSVKDSFRALDLAALDFQVFFEAAWLWRAPSAAGPRSIYTTTRWTWVRSAAELEQWEVAWSGNAANRASTPQTRLFLPPLLAEPDVVFIAGYQAEAIVAGAIANRADDVVGLSNVFAPLRNRSEFWAGCIASAEKRFPGLPLVGYQHGSDLAVAQAAGFERVQNLRVWVRV